jgi:ferritin heavy chain
MGVRVAAQASNNDQPGAGAGAITGVVFEPFREVQSQNFQLPETLDHSFARQRYEDSCEAAINDQIK